MANEINFINKKTRVAVVFFSLSLVAISILAYWLWLNNFTMPALLSLLLIVVVIFALIRQYGANDAKFKTLISSLIYDDFEVHFNDSPSAGEAAKVNYLLNKLSDKYRTLRTQKEFQEQYVEVIISNVDFGLVCFNTANKAIMVNDTLRKMLHKSYIPDLEGFQKIDEGLYHILAAMKPGDERIFQLNELFTKTVLKIKRSLIHFKGEEMSLFSFVDISKQMSEQELVAWDKLTRVLTHEIMNSVSPIASLSSAMNGLIAGQTTLEGEALDDLKLSLSAISNRSSGLLDFTKQYKKLAISLELQIEVFSIADWLQEVQQLFATDMKNMDIQLKISNLNATEIRCDKKLMTMAVINLIKNAAESFPPDSADKIISIKAVQEAGQLQLSIADNGTGIEAEILQQIFVPFYTTKKSGSGIGLSLTRKIIHAHGGEINVWSELGQGSVFTIKLAA